jgi:hypothetical protein
LTYFFVGGSERSGTSLLQSILCSDEAVNPLIAEAVLFRFIIEAYRNGKPYFETKGGDFFNDWDAYTSFHAATAVKFLESTRGRYAPANHLVLKEPGLTRLFPDLYELLPQAKFVVIVRDPRDTVCSLVKVSERMGDRNHPLSGAAGDLVRLCRYYRSYYRPAFNYRNPGFQRNLCVVKYEDLVLNTPAVVDRLRDFTQLDLAQFDPGDPWKRSRLDYDELASHKDHQPWQSELRGKALSADKVGIYRENLDQQDLQVVERECADFLARFQYAIED